LGKNKQRASCAECPLLAMMVPVRELETLSGGAQAVPSPQPDAEVQLGE